LTGNAVPPRLARSLGRYLRQHLEGSSFHILADAGNVTARNDRKIEPGGYPDLSWPARFMVDAVIEQLSASIYESQFLDCDVQISPTWLSQQ
jgi:hypothetical protein